MHRDCRLARAFMDAFNACDSARMKDVLASDAAYIDSTGEAIEGSTNIVGLAAWLHGVDPSFRSVVEDCTSHRGRVLTTGHVESDEPGRSGRVLFEFALEKLGPFGINGARISRIQSFRRDNPLPLVKLYRGSQPREEITLQQTG